MKVSQSRSHPASSAVCRLSSDLKLKAFPLQHAEQSVDFPENLKQIMNGHVAIISGGLQMYGATSCTWTLTYSVLDRSVVEAELLEQAAQIRAKGLKSVVISRICSYPHRASLSLLLSCSILVFPLDVTERTNTSPGTFFVASLDPMSTMFAREMVFYLLCTQHQNTMLTSFVFQ